MGRRLAIAAAVVAATAVCAAARADAGEGDLDLATLMPPDTVAYVESGSLGRQMETAIGMLEGTAFADPFAAIPDAGPGVRQALGAVFNPAMMEEACKVRGWAAGTQGLAWTENGPEPKIVSVLDLGPNNGLRPMAMMGIMMAGVPAGCIENMDLIRVSDPAGGGIAYDDRMVIFGRPFEQLEWCVKQYVGGGAGPSLATQSTAFARFDRSFRSGSLVSFWVDTERALQTLQGAPGPGGEGLKAVLEALQGAGVQDVTCLIVFDPQDPFVEASVDLDPGQASPLYETVRTGPLGTDVLRCVPSDAIALIAGGVSQAQLAALTSQLPIGPGDNPLADVGQVALFMRPPDPQAAALGAPPIALAESLGIVATVRPGIPAQDLLESLRRLGDLLAMEAGSPVYPADTEDGMVEFALPAGSPVAGIYLAQGDGFVIASLSREVIHASLEAAQSGNSALTEGPLHASLARLDEAVSSVALASAGDLAAAITALNNAAEPLEEELAGLLGDLAKVLQGACLQATASEGPASVTVRAGATGLPALADALPVFMALGSYERPVTPFDPVAVQRSVGLIRVDGEADDWSGIEPLPWTQGWGDVGQVRLAWRDNGLYGLVTSSDLAIEVDDTQPWMTDGLQVFIEADNARRHAHSAQSRGIMFWPTPLDGPGGANIQTEDHGGGASRGLGTDEVSGIECAWGTTDSGYALEFYVPSSALGAGRLVSGSEIGLCLLLRNGSVTPAASFCAEENSDTWRRPDMWGAIRLNAG